MQSGAPKRIVQRLKICRSVRGEFAIDLGERVRKSEYPRMEHHPRNGRNGRMAAADWPIHRITQNGMTDGLKMGAYLMGTACARHQNKMRCGGTEWPLNPIPRDGGFGKLRVGRGSFEVASIGPEGQFDHTLAGFGNAMYERFVLSDDGMLFELRREPAMRFSGLCHDHDPRGVFVQTMD